MSKDKDKEDNIEDTDLEDLLSDDDDFKDMLDEEDDLDNDLSDFDDDVGTMDDFTEDEKSLAENENMDLSEEKSALESNSKPSKNLEPTPKKEKSLDTPLPKKEVPPVEKKPPLKEKPKEVSEPTHVEVINEEMEALDSISLTLSVELSRLQVPLKKVLEMRPGNILDMEIPKQGFVDLIVSGKKVGQGELVKLGDVVGIRILEMGTKSF